MSAALLLSAGFAVGLAGRARLGDHYGPLFRVQLVAGMGVLALLAGWSFDGAWRHLPALGLLLVAQLGAVLLAGWLFRERREAPLLAFAMYGNPGFWTLPVAAATLGPAAAVVVVAYDMVFQPRLMLGIGLLRRRAPVPQSARTAGADYAPLLGALSGLTLAQAVAAPPVVTDAVALLGTVLAVTGAVLLGVAWPRGRWGSTQELALAARAYALFVTVVPAVLLGAALAGLAIPPAVWLLALGPVPSATLSFARLYGYSTRLAASALALSITGALALLPVALWLARSLP